MKFLDVRAAGFGKLREESISFAPGFTLVYGQNEAGKSTWHAALYAALCGMRRTRTETPDEDFIRQYRPWDFPDPWEVSATVLLEDGRKVRLRQELIDRIECRATDVDLGRDYTSDINNEGCPDGALWLGLDRRSFIATACIRQSQLLEVLNNPDILQTHLQRAAATCAVNSSGAHALQLVEAYRSERVGEDRPNSNKPLPAAIRRVETLKRALAASRTEHVRYLELIATENRSKSKLGKLRAEWSLARAIIADRDATDWERRLKRVQQIIATHPERPSGDIEQLIELAQEVATAVRIWQERPALPDISGATAAEIEAEILKLPLYPSGELEPDPQVLKSEAELLASKYALTLHSQTEPPQPVIPDTRGVSGERLKQLSAVLSEAEPEVDERLEEALVGTPVSERLIQRIFTAVDLWDRRPISNSQALVRVSAAEIRREIESLPVVEEGDLKPASDVVDLANVFSSAKEAVRQHTLNRPKDPSFPKVQVTPAEIRTFAQRLLEPSASTVLDSGVWKRSSLNKEIAALVQARSRTVTMTAVASVAPLALAGYFLGLERIAITGGIFAALAALVAVVALLKSGPIKAKQQELDNLPAEPVAPPTVTMVPNRELMSRLERLGLPTTEAELEGVARTIEMAQAEEQILNLWKESEKRLQAAVERAGEQLYSALYRRVRGDFRRVEDALEEYQRQCAERARVSALSSRREDLERQLAAKIEAETSAAEIKKSQESAAVELRAVASECDVTADDDEELAKRLKEFVREADRRKMLEKELGQHIFVRSAWKKRQSDATKELQSKGLPAQSDIIRSLAEEVDKAQMMKTTYDIWKSTFTKLSDDYNGRKTHMTRLLAGKGLKGDTDVEEALKRYRAECDDRARTAVEARRREHLERQLESRKQIEEAAARVEMQRQNAKQGLFAAAELCGLIPDAEAPLSEALLQWMSVTSKTIRKQQDALAEWRELDTMLEGRSLQEFKEKAEQHRESALVLGSAFSGDELREAMPHLAEYEANMPHLTSQLDAAGQELANLQGQIHNYETRPTSVSDAEEELRAAEEELSKVRSLSETLDATHSFLSQAKNKVFRDIAPFLADSVKKWLPEITLGRYRDARVDPLTLQVHVCDENGKWRQAALLSYGTAEQIYLLLRLAMTEYLTKPSEVCPLILDDITVQSDSRRKRRILDTLKTVSETRQVILFSQEEEVYQWASESLSDPAGRIVDLAADTVNAHGPKKLMHSNGHGRKLDAHQSISSSRPSA
jgi:uncharacterized protein YhaN